MKELLFRFLREEEGQDLVEYTLLLAFVCPASAALFINAGACNPCTAR
jgi:Flp pilus assembly pilin Flp